MASGADDSRVPGSGDSDQAVEANGASRWADWTLNRVLVVAGFGLGFLGPLVFCTTDPSFVGPPLPPFLSRVVLSGGLLWGARPRGSSVGAGGDSFVAVF